MLRGFIVGSCLGLLIPLLFGNDAREATLFRLGTKNSQALEQEVLHTLDLFNRYYVQFFTSGGDLTGLDVIPAANLVKRRIVQEINMWSDRDRILSHDRHRFHVTSIRILSPRRAIVETDETWALIMRNRTTGKRMKGVKNIYIQVRYNMDKIDRGWVVSDFQVFPAGETLPALPEGQA